MRQTMSELVLFATMAALGGEAGAQTAPTCSFDPGTATLAVTVDGVAAALSVGGAGAIRLNGAICPGARVTTTDAIAVNGGALADSVSLTGSFAPGLTPEGTGGSEIEILLALGGGADEVVVNLSGAADLLTFSAGGIDTGSDFDEDVTFTGVETIEINGGGGDDDIDASLYAGSAALVLRGGSGADTLVGSPAADVLIGGAGNDTVFGDGGDDAVKQGTASDGADQTSGGPGRDTIDYSARMNAVTIRLGQATPTADSGEIGEGDVIQADIEVGIGGAGADAISVLGNREGIGGAGNDELGGGNGTQTLRGGPGDDRVVGGGGDDNLYGDDGDDFLLGNSGNDLMFGGSGNDDLVGAGGDDVLHGGPGSDFLDGGNQRDEYFGEGGNDIINNNDGFEDPDPEVVNCGAGSADDAEFDERDTFIGCEL